MNNFEIPVFISIPISVVAMLGTIGWSIWSMFQPDDPPMRDPQTDGKMGWLGLSFMVPITILVAVMMTVETSDWYFKARQGPVLTKYSRGHLREAWYWALLRDKEELRHGAGMYVYYAIGETDIYLSASKFNYWCDDAEIEYAGHVRTNSHGDLLLGPWPKSYFYPYF